MRNIRKGKVIFAACAQVSLSGTIDAHVRKLTVHSLVDDSCLWIRVTDCRGRFDRLERELFEASSDLCLNRIFMTPRAAYRFCERMKLLKLSALEESIAREEAAALVKTDEYRRFVAGKSVAPNSIYSTTHCQ
ncbi:hypothetical protein RYA05_02295 [Pseudomonas syringae pv. actinidiae]|nr:hypothetical protein [Pseudomonas syringae pv. actinidiae]